MRYMLNKTHSKLTFGNQIWYNIGVPNRGNTHYSCNTDFEVKEASPEVRRFLLSL